jgi:hypothetical protein
VAAAFLAIAGAAAPGRAQAPLTIEGRAGMLAPVDGFRRGPERGGTLAPALTFGVQLALERTQGRHLYVGFSQHRVDCTDDGCGRGGRYVATSWDAGVRFDLGPVPWVPWVRLGLTVPKVELDRPAPERGDVSALGIGVEGGAGLRVAVADPFYLSPGVRFGAADADLPRGGVLRMRYLILDVGVVLGF